MCDVVMNVCHAAGELNDGEKRENEECKETIRTREKELKKLRQQLASLNGTIEERGGDSKSLKRQIRYECVYMLNT